MFRTAGVPMRLRAEVNLTSTICDLVRMGQGVAIMNSLSGRGYEHALEMRPLTTHLANRYGVLHLADRGLSVPAQQLIAAVREDLAEAMPEVYLDEA